MPENSVFYANFALPAHELRMCWLCKQPGATIETEPEPPDMEAWWFHPECHKKLQAILYND